MRDSPETSSGQAMWPIKINYKHLKIILLILISGLSLFSCGKESSDFNPSFNDSEIPELGMTEKELYDKILGNLVGSAMPWGLPRKCGHEKIFNLKKNPPRKTA